MVRIQYLVPIDGSVHSEVAARHALRLAEKYGAEVSILNVVDTYKYEIPEISGALREKGEKWVDGVKKLAEEKKITVRESRVLLGSPSHEILREAERIDADLIVMGARGVGEAKIMGSVANRVLRDAKCHVLLVRDRIENEQYYRKILIPTDGGKDSLHAARFASSLARRFKAELVTMHVVDIGREVLGERITLPPESVERIKRELIDKANKVMAGVVEISKAKDIEIKTMIREGKPAAEIIKAAKEGNFDLVVIGAAGKGAISRFFLGSLSEKVASTVPCSAFVVKGTRVERIVTAPLE